MRCTVNKDHEYCLRTLGIECLGSESEDVCRKSSHFKTSGSWFFWMNWMSSELLRIIVAPGAEKRYSATTREHWPIGGHLGDNFLDEA